MQTTAVIDTNIFIDYLRDKAPAADFIEALLMGGSKPGCSVITRMELLAGIRRGRV